MAKMMISFVLSLALGAASVASSSLLSFTSSGTETSDGRKRLGSSSAAAKRSLDNGDGNGNGNGDLVRGGAPPSLLSDGSTTSLGRGRELLHVGLPFDYVNADCRAVCSGDEDDNNTGTIAPVLNPCPQCGPDYSAQHCNSCCHGGASSLKVRWHGCAGNVSLPSLRQSLEDCGVDPGSYDPDAVRFENMTTDMTTSSPD